MTEPALKPHKVTFSREGVEKSLTAAEDRRRSRQAQKRRMELAFLAILVGFIIVAAIGIKRRAPWYGNHVEPVMKQAFAWLSVDRRAPGGDAEGIGVSLPTYPLPSDADWLLVAGDRDDNGYGTIERTEPDSPGGLAEARPELRINISTRPRPPDLDFRQVREAVRRHVYSQPRPLRRLEAERVINIAGARSHLIRLMKFVPFETGPGGLRLRGGATPAGTVIGANDSGLLLMPEGRSKATTIRWGDLAFEQYVAFFQYYIARRIEFEGTPSWHVLMDAGKLTPVRARRDAAGECLLVGLLCDWYGYPSVGEKFLKLAASYDPSSSAVRFLKADAGSREADSGS